MARMSLLWVRQMAQEKNVSLLIPCLGFLREMVA
jgi:hypothetical protein